MPGRDDFPPILWGKIKEKSDLYSFEEHPMLNLPEDRFFGPDPTQKEIALELYHLVAGLPIVSPHGHVDPRLFADENYTFGSPVEMLILPDHYVFRMLYSQGITFETLGIPPRGANLAGYQLPEEKLRAIWQTFADHYYLFRATPSGIWLDSEFSQVFGVRKKLNSQTAQEIYDQIAEKLASPEFRPRRLFERFNIEVLCTTDAATDTLEHHAAIRSSSWAGQVLPTFRPDQVVNLETPGWKDHITRLSETSAINVHDYASFILALENRRAFFKGMGAKATDHAVGTPYTAELPIDQANAIFQRALKGDANAADAQQFMGHMLMEMARMSIEDGLVMQLHPGSFRNHNPAIFAAYGPDKGADIPLQIEFTRNLHPLLAKYGSDPRLSLILFTLDESPYAREMAPLAGHYPALKLGPPWWFHDSLNGIQRYFDQVIETAGLYNTAGFNDDTRAFASIPARHDVWRRAGANWLGGLAARKMVDLEDAREMMRDLAYRLTKKAYHLEKI
jgi:glucuronate isomerase